jgi:prevent-host-death family protein
MARAKVSKKRKVLSKPTRNGSGTRDVPAAVLDPLGGVIQALHTLTRLNVSKAREEFPEIVNRAAYGKERTIVSRRGKDLAAVIPIEDLRLLERLAREEIDRIDLEDARAALKEAEEKGTIPLRNLIRELGD